MPSPNPQAYDLARETLAPEEACRIKHTDCKYYERCLDLACKRDWNQFTCKDCHAYTPLVFDITQVECSEPSYSLVSVGRSYSPGGRGRR